MKLGVVSPLTGLEASDAAASWSPEFLAHDLIADLLREQADLTAVERFAQFHSGAPAPLQGRYYSALIPAAPPGPGQQYGFEVDLDRCSGCKACVSACHSLNGLDEGEAWRDVGMLIGGTFSLPVIQHVTSACHHCVDPACLSACPVDAYEKDPITGIVRHLDDQCFGCQYCTLACPYDVPKFHAGKGIVRKCDMCGDRLASGEAPACVQACPHEAIKIRVVDVRDIQARAEAGQFLSCAPEPSITQPSTVYLTKRNAEDLGDVKPGDADRLKPEHAHNPLVAMLVLTQLSVGGFLINGLSLIMGAGEIRGLAPLSLILGYAGLAASLLHLGRPMFAYRAILGIRHSWLSREVASFGMYINLATACVVLDHFQLSTLFNVPLLLLTMMSGVIAVFTSVMVYHVVKRPFWNIRLSGIKFAGTTLILGLASSLACLGFSGERGRNVAIVALSLAAISVAKLGFETRWMKRAFASETDPINKSAKLLRGALRTVSGRRVFWGIYGGIIVPVIAAVGVFGADRGVLLAASILVLPLTVVAELHERWLFFTAVVKPKMPGGY